MSRWYTRNFPAMYFAWDWYLYDKTGSRLGLCRAGDPEGWVVFESWDGTVRYRCIGLGRGGGGGGGDYDYSCILCRVFLWFADLLIYLVVCLNRHVRSRKAHH